MKENPKVSLVIVPFDNFDFFEKALDSILDNTDYLNFEVIVSHNPCENQEINRRILELCMDKRYNLKSGRFKFIINEKNLYHGLGCAKGVEIANSESEYIVLANDDIFIPGNELNWLNEMVEFMSMNENAATVTPCLLYPQKESIYWMGKQNPENPQHDFLHYSRSDDRLPKEPITTVYNNMACCLIRRKLLDEVKIGIDTPPHYGSDSGFCNKVKELHPQMEHWVIPGIKIYHWNIFALRESHGKDPVVDG